MIDIAIYVISSTSLLVLSWCLLFLLWDNYKERQWRKRNPDEWLRLEGLRRGFYKRNKWDDE
jgi:hypothetical protein